MPENPLDTLDLLAQLTVGSESEALRVLAEAGADTAWLQEQFRSRKLGSDPRSFTRDARQLLDKAFELAQEFGHRDTDWRHLLKAALVLDSPALSYLGEAGTDTRRLGKLLDGRLQGGG